MRDMISADIADYVLAFNVKSAAARGTAIHQHIAVPGMENFDFADVEKRMVGWWKTEADRYSNRYNNDWRRDDTYESTMRDYQRQAIHAALDGKASEFTYRPGTGKSAMQYESARLAFERDPTLSILVHMKGGAHIVNSFAEYHALTRGGVDDLAIVKEHAYRQAQSRIHRAHLQPVIMTINAADIDGKIIRALQSKGSIVKGLSDGKEDRTAPEASDVWADPSRTDGGRYRAFTDGGSDPSFLDGKRKSAQPREVPLRSQGFEYDPHGPLAVRKSAPSLGEKHTGGVVSIFDITIVKEPGGAVAQIKAGSLWDGKGYQSGYTATAPELDRLIVELGKARDQIRQANRPKHYFGQTR